VTIDVAAKPSRIPLALYISAGVLAAGGVAFDLLAVQPVRRDLQATNGGYETERATFDQRRDIAIGVFAAAAVTAVAGVVLHYKLRAPVEIAATATAGGLAVEVAWRR
jgi:hypothetical protein